MALNEEKNSYVVSAPGKVILFGEHSVVYKKAAVSTSIGKRLFVKTKFKSGNTVSLKLPQISADLTCDLQSIQQVVKVKCPLQTLDDEFSLDKPDVIEYNTFFESLKLNLETLGVDMNSTQTKTTAAFLGFLFLLRGMCQSLGSKLVPFSMEVTSDLEIGAGTGSSAAFSVALAGSIFQLRKCIENDVNIYPLTQNINDSVIIHSYPAESGFTLDEVRIINKWAFCVEKIMHGRPSGIDNTTCTFGSVVVTSQESTRPGELTFRFLENVPKITILLISTGVSRNTANLVVKVRTLREENTLAVDAILNAMDVIAQEASKTLDALSKNSGDSLTIAGYFRVLSDLMELNHGLLRTLGVSHQSLEKIVEVSKQHGMCSKLTGAGGGGYAITLVPPNVPKEKIEDLKRELGPLFCVTEINIAEDGIRLEE